MGCQISKDENHDIISIETDQEFKLSYKQLVSQDRGHVFELYHFSTILHRSNYSIVRKVISRASQQSRVCKIVPLVNQKFFSVVSEVEYLKKLDHPNIVQILEYFLQPSFLYIVMEYVPGDRLLSQFNKIKEGVLFDDVVQVMRQILLAVEFCHCKQIAHRAITTQNIVLFFRDNQPFIKLVDFSQACAVGCPNASPISYEKRNVLLSDSQAHETDKIDIFDCGVVFLAMLLGKKVKLVQVQVNYKDLAQNVVKAAQTAGLSKRVQEHLIDLITKMLSENPKQRPSAMDCLNHEFFKLFNKKISSKKALQCLMNFHPDSDLKYLLSMYAGLNMTSTMDKAEHLAQFYNLDKNKDGEIQLEQLIQSIQNTFGLDYEKSKDHAEEMFKNLDKNRSGALNFSQYITGTMQLSKLMSNAFLQKMFDEIDVNKDGFISEQEVNNLILGIDRYNVLQGQKQVNFKQFRSMMLKMLQKPDKPNLSRTDS